ncbi:HAD family hydrolase, partial [Escherichia coli]|nr:HAD family hydrolase [Escherichia coli]
GLPLALVAGFEAVPGHGVRGSIEGRSVLLGNRRFLRRENIDPTGAEEAMTRLESDGKTAMLLAVEGRLAGVIAVADTLKPEAPEAVR